MWFSLCPWYYWPRASQVVLNHLRNGRCTSSTDWVAEELSSPTASRKTTILDSGISPTEPNSTGHSRTTLAGQRFSIATCARTINSTYASFDVFWIEKHHYWLGFRCHNKDCIWTAKNDGVYIRNLSTNQDEFIHPWGTHW